MLFMLLCSVPSRGVAPRVKATGVLSVSCGPCLTGPGTVPSMRVERPGGDGLLRLVGLISYVAAAGLAILGAALWVTGSEPLPWLIAAAVCVAVSLLTNPAPPR